MIVAIDIGGTSTRIGVSNDCRTIHRSQVIKTPRKFRDGLHAIQQAVEKFSSGKKIKAVVCGVAGGLDPQHGSVFCSLHLRNWEKKPLKRELSRIVRAPVTLENDTALVGLGEAVTGAGKGSRIVAYLSISSGIGGVRVVDQQIDANALGFEPGHQILFANTSGTTLVRPDSTFGGGEFGRTFQKRYGVNPESTRSRKIWNAVERNISVVVHNAIVFWSPDVVVLGGGLTQPMSIPNIRSRVKKMLYIFPRTPRIVRGKLGSTGGLVGGLALLRTRKTLA